MKFRCLESGSDTLFGAESEQSDVRNVEYSPNNTCFQPPRTDLLMIQEV